MSKLVNIACTVDYPPFCYEIADKLRGFHVDAATLVLSLEDIPFKVQAFSWVDLANLMLEPSGFDIFACGMTHTEEREKIGSFSGPWISSKSVVVGRADHAEPNIKILGVNQGAYLEGLARKHFPDTPLVLCDDNAKLPELLSTNKVSHVLTDELEFRAWLRAKYDDFEVCMTVNKQRQGLFFIDRILGEKFCDFLKNPSYQTRILELASFYGIDKDTITF